MNRRAFHRVRALLLPLLCLVALLALAPSAEAASADPEGAAQALISASKIMEPTVDLSEYHITPEQLQDIFNDSSNQGAFPWYVDWYQSTHYTNSGLVATVTLQFLDPTLYDYRLYEQRVAEILDQTVHEGMSDWQIALSIHDYLVAHITYDETLTYFQGYDGIVNGYTVCNGYAEAYMDLLNRVGIPCHKVISEESQMNHSWNLVYVSGNWFHVDATWDDPVTNVEGKVLHDYFLISDKTISDSNHNHYGWDSDITCSFTDWDSGLFWHGINSQICYADASTCYLRYKTDTTVYTLYRITDYGGTWDALTAADAGYIDIGGSKEYSYFYDHYGLSLWNGRLYYSDMTKVYSVKPDGSGKKTVYTHDYSSKKTYIAGCHVQDGMLYITFSTHAGKLSTKTVDLGIQHHTHSYKRTEVEATCISYGYSVYACSCGIRYEADRTQLGDHSYTTKTIAPTCTEKGYDLLTCKHCGDSHRDNYRDPLSHDFSTVTVPPTCTEKGYDLLTCVLCGYSKKQNEVPGGHSYGAGVVIREATESAEGLLQYTCQVCGDITTDSIPRLEPAASVATEESSDPEQRPPDSSTQQDPLPELPWSRVFLIVLMAVVILLLSRKRKQKKAKTKPVHAPVPSASSGRFCPNCGKALPPDCHFCPNCGTKRPE